MKPVTLKKQSYRSPDGPVVLLIMDGIGIGSLSDGDAVRSAHTPHLDWLREHALATSLQAHGTAVGLPSDDEMGNSEVGHNAIGCGRVYAQGAKLVNQAIAEGSLFQGSAWREITRTCLQNNGTLHFIGLFSDGYVHSHIDHLKAMLQHAKAEGVKTARIHILLDGRDVGETSALEYVEPFERYLGELNEDGKFDAAIASGGGRMHITMDRYHADWDMVKRGWLTHVKAEGRHFGSATEAIETLRREIPGVLDQDLKAFVIDRDNKPLGPIRDGDSVIFFNFRGDRAIEISRAFEDDDFDGFDRGCKPDVCFAGMMQYDGDLKIPSRFLVAPPTIERTLGEYLARTGVPQLAVSETQKFGHVTYFFNGNRSGKFDEKLETYLEIPSDRVPYEQRPWMKAAEITDKITAAIDENKYPFIRLNYPNGDMVGHTGIYQAAEIAVSCVDLCLGRVIEAVRRRGGILLVSADHGNADDMVERDKQDQPKIDPETGRVKARTSHSLNPVPAMIYAPADPAAWRLATGSERMGISSLAATCLTLLGYEPPADFDPSIVVRA